MLQEDRLLLNSNSLKKVNGIDGEDGFFERTKKTELLPKIEKEQFDE